MEGYERNHSIVSGPAPGKVHLTVRLGNFGDLQQWEWAGKEGRGLTEEGVLRIVQSSVKGSSKTHRMGMFPTGKYVTRKCSVARRNHFWKEKFE